MGNEKQQKEVAKEKEVVSTTLDDVVETFLERIESLNECEGQVLPVLAARAKRRGLQLADFIKEHSASATYVEDHFEAKIQVGASEVKHFKELARDYRRSTVASEITANSLFISLFTLFDAYVSELLIFIFTNRANVANLIERSLTFKEISSMGSIEKAYEHLVRTEVESVLRESYEDQFDYMEKKFGLKLRSSLDIWPKFIEASQRRHLLVHADGRVSAQYINACTRVGYEWSDDKEPTIGSRLGVSHEYFSENVKVCFELVLKLGQVLQRKLFPDQLEIADNHLSGKLYHLLEYERWDEAKSIGKFACELPRHSSDSLKRRMKVNYAQAFRWSGDVDRAKACLNEDDWSACSKVFRLAVAAIRDDLEEALSLVRSIGKNDEDVDISSYREWPLFKDLREKKEFIELVEEVFDEPIHQIQQPLSYSMQDKQDGGAERTDAWSSLVATWSKMAGVNDSADVGDSLDDEAEN